MATVGAESAAVDAADAAGFGVAGLLPLARAKALHQSSMNYLETSSVYRKRAR